MNKVKVELNKAAVRELLKSPEMAAVCKSVADAICKRCGAGYATDLYTGRNRVNSMIYPESSQAQADNSENNTILRSLK